MASQGPPRAAGRGRRGRGSRGGPGPRLGARGGSAAASQQTSPGPSPSQSGPPVSQPAPSEAHWGSTVHCPPTLWSSAPPSSYAGTPSYAGVPSGVEGPRDDPPSTVPPGSTVDSASDLELEVVRLRTDLGWLRARYDGLLEDNKADIDRERSLSSLAAGELRARIEALEDRAVTAESQLEYVLNDDTDLSSRYAELEKEARTERQVRELERERDAATIASLREQVKQLRAGATGPARPPSPAASTSSTSSRSVSPAMKTSADAEKRGCRRAHVGHHQPTGRERRALSQAGRGRGRARGPSAQRVRWWTSSTSADGERARLRRFVWARQQIACAHRLLPCPSDDHSSWIRRATRSAAHRARLLAP